LDAVLREEVMRQVVGRTPQLRPGTVRATVDDGVVTLTGRTARKATAVAVARLTATVPGVTDVVDRLTFDVDDTVTATPRTAERRPFRGLRTAPAQPANRSNQDCGPGTGPAPDSPERNRDAMAGR
jgi:hypothetical protein